VATSGSFVRVELKGVNGSFGEISLTRLSYGIPLSFESISRSRHCSEVELRECIEGANDNLFALTWPSPVDGRVLASEATSLSGNRLLEVVGELV